MPEKENLELDPYFFNLINMFASAAWQQLGKIPSQIDGTIHRDLKSAQLTIDMLLMIRDKTKGNLNKKEEDILSSAISNLQINYADEAAKPDPKTEEKAEENKKTCDHGQDCDCN
ncbi:MAG: DUF1844 domain-containing protein [Endomicrobium sp.]|jgi:hypothetical protein|nr:DUF1844 domain-containing protein [Endomicrobium sp.]